MNVLTYPGSRLTRSNASLMSGAATISIPSALGTRSSGTSDERVVPQPETLELRLFNALAGAKIWTAQVARHLDRAARDRYFHQLDVLHDPDEWFGTDKPVSLESYKGFIRFMLMLGGNSKPALALSPRGTLLAVWRAQDARLTIEFLTSARVRWLVAQPVGEEVERTAGDAGLDRLLALLKPYSPEKWFGST